MSGEVDLIATLCDPKTLDDFIDDTHVNYNNAVDQREWLGWEGVREYAKQRVRYFEKDDDTLTMADALIDKWAARDEAAEAA